MKRMFKKFLLTALLATGVTGSALANTPDALRPSPTVVASMQLAHRGGGHWKQVREWVPPVYQRVPVYDHCGRIRGHRTVCVRAGQWVCRQVWVRCHCHCR